MRRLRSRSLSYNLAGRLRCPVRRVTRLYSPLKPRCKGNLNSNQAFAAAAWLQEVSKLQPYLFDPMIEKPAMLCEKPQMLLAL